MSRPLIVAEIGINHQGSIEIAKNLISMAADYGADYVKFQKRSPDICVPESQKYLRKKTMWGNITYLDYKKRMEFGKYEYDEINKYCNELNIKWFASPWDCESVDFLMQYDIPFLKVASASITDFDLLQQVNAYDIPVIISTGMSSEEEINKAINCLDNKIEYILHCTSTYPTADKDMNMQGINTLKRNYGNKFKIGFSNHSMKIIYLIQAYIMGAQMLEFHITLNRNMTGSDHAASIGPIGFERIMKHIDSIETGYGNGKIECLESEISIKEKLRK